MYVEWPSHSSHGEAIGECASVMGFINNHIPIHYS
jgi:hypothetical protein